MRNLILVLALGTAAGVQVTRELFPRFNTVEPVYDLIHRIESRSHVPSSTPASWLPQSTEDGDSADPANPACLVVLPAATARPELAPQCGVDEPVASDNAFLGL